MLSNKAIATCSSPCLPMFEQEALKLIDLGLVHPAYDYILKCSHTFNLLDARGMISVSDRAGYLGRIRKMARSVDPSLCG